MQLKLLKKRKTYQQRDNRLRRIVRRLCKNHIPQDKDRWPKNWQPLTIAQLFDR